MFDNPGENFKRNWAKSVEAWNKQGPVWGTVWNVGEGVYRLGKNFWDAIGPTGHNIVNSAIVGALDVATLDPKVIAGMPDDIKSVWNEHPVEDYEPFLSNPIPQGTKQIQGTYPPLKFRSPVRQNATVEALPIHPNEVPGEPPKGWSRIGEHAYAEHGIKGNHWRRVITRDAAGNWVSVTVGDKSGGDLEQIGLVRLRGHG